MTIKTEGLTIPIYQITCLNLECKTERYLSDKKDRRCIECRGKTYSKHLTMLGISFDGLEVKAMANKDYS